MLHTLRRFAAPVTTPLAALAFAALTTSAQAQVGQPLPEDVALVDFAQTVAEDFEDFSGRAILIEYFAHW
jgi:hypothetical protein